MAKDNTAVEPVEQAEQAGVPMTLAEFCTRLSVTVKRVELIGGFDHSERAAGRLSDTAENYAARYAAFINKPA